MDKLVPLYVIPIFRGTAIGSWESLVPIPGVLVNGRNARMAAKDATGDTALAKDEAGTGEHFCESGSGERTAFVIPVKVPGIKLMNYTRGETSLEFRDGSVMTCRAFEADLRRKVSDPMARMRRLAGLSS